MQRYHWKIYITRLIHVFNVVGSDQRIQNCDWYFEQCVENAVNSGDCERDEAAFK